MDEITLTKIKNNGAPTSYNVARCTGKRHDNVIRDIRLILKQSQLKEIDYLRKEKQKKGRIFMYYLLTPLLMDLLLARYSRQYGINLICKLHNNEKI